MEAVEVVVVGHRHQVSVVTHLHEVPVKGSTCCINDLDQRQLKMTSTTIRIEVTKIG